MDASRGEVGRQGENIGLDPGSPGMAKKSFFRGRRDYKGRKDEMVVERKDRA
jgi:hypothetical protein